MRLDNVCKNFTVFWLYLIPYNINNSIFDLLSAFQTEHGIFQPDIFVKFCNKLFYAILRFL